MHLPPSRRVRLSISLLTVALVSVACSSSGGGSGATPPPKSSSPAAPASAAPSGTTSLGPDVGAGLAGVGTLPPAASAWPQANYDARHSSGTAATGPQTGKVLWKHSIGGDATPGTVVAADGSVLAATNDGALFDLNAKTGAQVWKFDGGSTYGSDLSTSPAVLSGGTILWPGPADTVYALSPAGKLLWSQKLGGQALSPAIAGSNRVYVSDLAGHLSAFEITATSHRLVWTLDTGGQDYASASVGPDGTIYTAGGSGGQDLVAVRDLGSTGKIRWRFHVTKMIEVSNGVSADGIVVLGTNVGAEYGVRADGTQAWSAVTRNYSYSSSVVRPDGQSYFGDNVGELWSIASATGKVTGPLVPLGIHKEDIWSSPVVDAKGNVYWATTKGNVYGYSATGAKLFSTSVGAGVNSYPSLGADGTLYVSTTAGEVYAIGG